jgi:hypothetical protein
MALGKMKQLAGVIQGKKQGSGCANTALVFHAGKLLALHESDLPYALRMTCEVIVCGKFCPLEDELQATIEWYGACSHLTRWASFVIAGHD